MDIFDRAEGGPLPPKNPMNGWYEVEESGRGRPIQLWHALFPIQRIIEKQQQQKLKEDFTEKISDRWPLHEKKAP